MADLYGGVTKYGASYVNRPRQNWSKLAELADAIMYDNPIANAYQAAIPANIRFAIGNLIYPGVITERNFSKKELDNIKQMVDNMDKRILSTEDDYYNAQSNMHAASDDDEMVYNPMIGRLQQAGMVGDMLKGPKFPGVTYADMTTNYGTYDPYIYNQNLGEMVKRSFNNPVVNIQTSMGQFYPYKDNNGKRYIEDVYDFKKIGNAKWAGNDYKGLHKIMENWGTPTQMYIKLD